MSEYSTGFEPVEYSLVRHAPRSDRSALPGRNGLSAIRLEKVDDMPRQQFIDPVDRVAANAVEQMCQVRLRIETIQPGRTNQAVQGCRLLSRIRSTVTMWIRIVKRSPSGMKKYE